MAVSPGGRPADASGLGKPGSPRGLSDYTREIAHALMRKGVPKSRAIAIARASEAKRFSHSKNPAIAAAAVAAVAQDHVLDHRKKGRHDMSRTPTKLRPGSIPSGPGKGKFPVTNAHEVKSAVLLAGHAKGVSKRVVLAHVVAEAKRRKLKIPPSLQKTSLSIPAFATLRGGGMSVVDLDWSSFDSNRPAGQPAQPPPDLLTAQTHTNIAAFQKAHGLKPTGQLDPATVAWLNNPKNSAVAQKAAAGAAKKGAAAATKAQKAAVAAAKKQAAAATKLTNQQAAAAKKAATQTAAQQKAATKQAAANQKAAAAAGKAAIGAGGATRGVSLSVPIVGSQDGGRMTGKPAFGGKKAAPFVKGGGRAKNIRALNIEKLKRAKVMRSAK